MTIVSSALLAGSKLGNAIKSHGKAAATFREREHLLAASALNHLQEHGGVEHLQSLYTLTPTNYRPALRKWAAEFGRCTFDEKEGVFKYAKGKKGDIAAALAVSPAEWEKEAANSNSPKVAGEYDYVKPFTAFAERAEKLLEEFESKNVPMPVVQAMEALKLAMSKAATTAGKVRVANAKPTVEIVGGTDTVAAKPAKGKGKAESAKPEAAAA